MKLGSQKCLGEAEAKEQRFPKEEYLTQRKRVRRSSSLKCLVVNESNLNMV